MLSRKSPRASATRARSLEDSSFSTFVQEMTKKGVVLEPLRIQNPPPGDHLGTVVSIDPNSLMHMVRFTHQSDTYSVSVLCKIRQAVGLTLLVRVDNDGFARPYSDCVTGVDHKGRGAKKRTEEERLKKNNQARIRAHAD